MVKFPTVNFFLNKLEHSNFISIYQLYELAKKKSNQFDLISINEKSIYRSIIGYLKACKISIFYLHPNKMKVSVNNKNNKLE